MYNNKYLIKIISYFLPRHAEILVIGEEYKIPAVIEGDIDKDSENEILALYKRDGNNYILILKLFSKKWHMVWNNRTPYSAINRFEIANLTSEYRQIAIGGKIEEEEGYKLSLLDWKEESLQEMLSEPMPFDKVYIEDIDGEDGLDEIALWKHKALEAYDIDLYRYKENGLVRDKSLEKHYFKTVVNYYEYLNQMDTEGHFYKTYLEEAKRKCEIDYKIEEVEEMEELKELEELEEIKRAPKDILVARTAYLEVEEVEEDIYLWGERQGEWLTDMKLAVTRDEKTRYEIMNIWGDKVYDYQMFVGDFTGNKRDDIWLGIKEHSDACVMHVCIYSLCEGGLKLILDTHDLEKDQDLENKIIEIYPVDKSLSGIYEVCYQTIGHRITWLRWENGMFVSHNHEVVENEGDENGYKNGSR